MSDAISRDPRLTLDDLLTRGGVDQAKHEAPGQKRNQTVYQYIMVRDHLLSGASIDPHIAKEQYGIKRSSLGTTISKLQRAYRWRLEKTHHWDRHGKRYTSYRVMLDKPAKVEAEQPAAAQVQSQTRPSPCIAVEKVNVTLGKDGPEILIVGEGEPAGKLPYKFRQIDLRYLFVNLKLLGEQAREV